MSLHEHIKEQIEEDLKLLKKYENELRFTKDPGEKNGMKIRIEELEQSIAERQEKIMSLPVSRTVPFVDLADRTFDNKRSEKPQISNHKSSWDIWQLQALSNLESEELLIIGGIFGWSGNGLVDSYSEKLHKELINYLNNGISLKILLQKPTSDYFVYASNLFDLRQERVKKFLEELFLVCLNVQSEWSSYQKFQKELEQVATIEIIPIENLFSWEFHGLYTDINTKIDSNSHVVRLYQMLRAQFKCGTRASRIIAIYQCLNEPHLREMFLDEYERFLKFLDMFYEENQ